MTKSKKLKIDKKKQLFKIRTINIFSTNKVTNHKICTGFLLENKFA